MQLVTSPAQPSDWRLMILMKYSFHCKKTVSALNVRCKRSKDDDKRLRVSKELQALYQVILSLCLKEQDTEPEEPE